MASVAPVLGIEYIRAENKKSPTKICLAVSGIAVCLWCFGYGMMGFQTDFTLAYIWRGIALFGVYFYLATEIYFVSFITNHKSKSDFILARILSALAVVVFLMVIQPSVVDFFEYNGRLAYSGNPCLARVIQGGYSLCLMLLLVSWAIAYFVKSKYWRDKNIVIFLFFSHFAMIVGMVLDVALPLVGVPSFPGSAIGGFVCFIFNMIIVERLNFFELSSNGMSNFIYHNVDTCVIFFNNEDRLAVANEFALKFFDLNEGDEPYFSELFQITPKESKKLFADNYTTAGKTEIKLNSRKGGKICSVILNGITDKHNEPVYTSCIVYDMTQEALKYQEVASLKELLQRDLEEKTEELEQLTLESIGTIAKTIDAKDEYTKGHSERVADYSVKLARKYGLPEEELQKIYSIALLHDIGKIGVRDSVLNKPGRLTDEEYEEIKQHTIIGGAILSEMSLIPHLSDGALYHHEWYNGGGYPKGLKGEEIPLVARIIGIADAYDAMNSKRVYRNALSHEEILDQLKKGAGTQFDPEILPVFLELLDEGAIG